MGKKSTEQAIGKADSQICKQITDGKMRGEEGAKGQYGFYIQCKKLPFLVSTPSFRLRLYVPTLSVFSIHLSFSILNRCFFAFLITPILFNFIFLLSSLLCQDKISYI
jgi:hypothetical protein